MWLVLFTIIYFEAVHLPIQRQTNCFLKLTLDKSSLNLLGTVNSIVNQKKYLEGYAAQHGFTNCVHYTDDSDIVEPSQEELAGQAFSGLVQLFAFYRQ